MQELGLGKRGVLSPFAFEFALKGEDFLILLHLELLKDVEELGFESVLFVEAVFELFLLAGFDAFLKVSELSGLFCAKGVEGGLNFEFAVLKPMGLFNLFELLDTLLHLMGLDITKLNHQSTFSV